MVTSSEFYHRPILGTVSTAIEDEHDEGNVTKEEFLSELEALALAHREAGTNAGCVECTDCVACVDCVFCSSSSRCYRSRYSSGCSDSSFLTHCHACRNSHSLVNCQQCDHCGDSNYLAHCSYCFECDYCFGCVGLVKKDFHILNRKYSRSEYFATVAKLRLELGVS
jgi:hypothetical protein